MQLIGTAGQVQQHQLLKCEVPPLPKGAAAADTDFLTELKCSKLLSFCHRYTMQPQVWW